jgi:PIN domain nuclease of toxin-antitoxin system
MSTSASVVSVASIWEVAIKHRLGTLPVAPGRFRDEIRDAGVSVLPVSDDHVVAESGLPASHADPFDRLLVAIAAAERLSLFTADEDLIALAKADSRLPIRAA